MTYTVGEMAKLLGVAPSTLRYYDKEGLLPFVGRSSGGMRVFQERDYEWLQIIQCLKDTGMALRDIRRYIDLAMEGDGTIQARLSIFEERRASVREQLRQLRSQRHKPRARRQRKHGGQPQYPRDEPPGGRAVAAGVGAGDFRHHQAGQRRQHRKREKQQRQRHALEVAVLRQRGRAAAGVERERQRNETAFGRLQCAGQQAVALHRPQDGVQFPPGVGVQRFAGAAGKLVVPKPCADSYNNYVKRYMPHKGPTPTPGTLFV